MAVDGTAIKEAEFYDKETEQNIKINLSVRDIVLFRLIERLIGAIAGLKK